MILGPLVFAMSISSCTSSLATRDSGAAIVRVVTDVPLAAMQLFRYGPVAYRDGLTNEPAAADEGRRQLVERPSR